MLIGLCFLSGQIYKKRSFGTKVDDEVFSSWDEENIFYLYYSYIFIQKQASMLVTPPISIKEITSYK